MIPGPASPVFLLWSRYWAIFRQAWSSRKASRSPGYTAHEAEFLPAALAVQERPVSGTSRYTAYVLLLLLSAGIAWAALSRVDIVIQATGKVVPTSRTRTISATETASVLAIDVREGQVVKAGDTLIELDSISADADRKRSEVDLRMAILDGRRAAALLRGLGSMTAPRFGPCDGSWECQQMSRSLDAQWAEFTTRLNQVDVQLEHDLLNLATARRRADDYEALLVHRDIAEHAWLDKKQAVEDLVAQVTALRLQRAEVVGQVRREALSALLEAEKANKARTVDVERASSKGRQSILTSPVDGVVQQLNVHTIGAAVAATQPLLLIVPREDKLEIEATVDAKDIGFLRTSLGAEVKFDAFDYTRYGTVPAEVTNVSADAIQDEKKGPQFAVNLKLARDQIVVDGKPAPLTPGMGVRVNIRSGSRTVLQYLLSPVLRHAQESLNER